MTATAQKAPGQTSEEGKRANRTKLVVAAVAVLALVGAGYWFFLKPADAVDPAPEPGEIVTLDPTQINLAGGHYLRLGLAVQFTADAHEVDGSKALDAAIELFSGQPLGQLRGQKRDRLKSRLLDQLDVAYDGHVHDIYFTEFVTQ